MKTPTEYLNNPGKSIREDYLTTGQAARELRIAPGTLQNWRSQGVGPKFIKHRRSVFYLKSEIEAYKDKYFQMYSSTTEWKKDTFT